MKARFVYKSLDFERGMNPKQSLGIGNEVYTWENIRPGNVIMTKNDKNLSISQYDNLSVSGSKHDIMPGKKYIIINSLEHTKHYYKGHQFAKYAWDLRYTSTYDLTGEDLSPGRKESSRSVHCQLSTLHHYFRILQPWEIEKILIEENK